MRAPGASPATVTRPTGEGRRNYTRPGRTHAISVLAPLAVLAVVATFWQTGALNSLLGVAQFSLPRLDVIFRAIYYDRSALLGDLWATARAALLGYAIGNALGYVVAVAMLALSGRAARTVTNMLVALQAVPIIAVVGLLALWIAAGTGFEAAVVAFVTFPAMASYAYRGLVALDAQALALLKSYNATATQTLWKLRRPHGQRLVFTALRYTVVVSVVGVVLSELIHGNTGLGVQIINTLAYYYADESWAALFVLVAFTLAWYLIISVLERVVAPWLHHTNH